MVKVRLIACLIWRDGSIVQSVQFKHTNVIGSASTAVDFFNIWGIDEIVLLDASRHTGSREEFYDTIERLSRRCFVPLTVGGWVTDVDEARRLLKVGADKVTVNTEAVRDPTLVKRLSKRFGSQSIVASIDSKRTGEGDNVIYVDRGSERTQWDTREWAQRVAEIGAGEIFLTSIDRDGTKEGYDINLVRTVTDAVSVPVVASGGAGEWEHLVPPVEQGHANAVSVANRFHHSQHSTRKAKEYMIEAGLDVREPYFYTVEVPRRPSYDVP